MCLAENRNTNWKHFRSSKLKSVLKLTQPKFSLIYLRFHLVNITRTRSVDSFPCSWLKFPSRTGRTTKKGDKLNTDTSNRWPGDLHTLTVTGHSTQHTGRRKPKRKLPRPRHWNTETLEHQESESGERAIFSTLRVIHLFVHVFKLSGIERKRKWALGAGGLRNWEERVASGA